MSQTPMGHWTSPGDAAAGPKKPSCIQLSLLPIKTKIVDANEWIDQRPDVARRRPELSC
jgi:hypothetical protein